MKKFAITLCILGSLGLTSGAFAYIQAEDSATVQSIKAQGFSTGMTHVTDTVRYNHSNGSVDPYYDLDPLSNATDEKSKWYTVVKRWLDPAQDDGLFGRHEITFTNNWFEMDSALMPEIKKKEATVQEEKKSESVNVQDTTPVDEIENL